jgi:putative flippase GtrA
MNTNLLKQIIRFVVVGFINTGIDFGVLNLLMFLTGIYGGRWIILLNSISFTVAVINSYLWNKYWTFKKEGSETGQIAREFSQFLAISIVGILLNSGIVYAITTLVSPLFGLSSALWANFAKVLATVVSMVWNFAGYKFFVFKK